MPGASRTVEMNVPMDALFKTIVDYESYPSFLDDIQSAKVIERSGDEVVVEYGLKVAFKSISYVLRMKQAAPDKVTWSLERSSVMKVSDGSWALEDLGDGRTRATYSVDVQPKGFVPGPVVKALTGRTLPATLQAFEDEARKRA